MCDNEQILRDMSNKIIDDYVNARKHNIGFDISRSFNQLIKNYHV